MLLESKSGTTEDVLAVLAQAADCPESIDTFLRTSAIPLIVYQLDAGNPRAQENVASALLNLCKFGGSQIIEEVLESSCVNSLSMLLTSRSPRGKSMQALCYKF